MQTYRVRETQQNEWDSEWEYLDKRFKIEKVLRAIQANTQFL